MKVRADRNRKSELLCQVGEHLSRRRIVRATSNFDRGAARRLEIFSEGAEFRPRQFVLAGMRQHRNAICRTNRGNDFSERGPRRFHIAWPAGTQVLPKCRSAVLDFAGFDEGKGEVRSADAGIPGATTHVVQIDLEALESEAFRNCFCASPPSFLLQDKCLLERGASRIDVESNDMDRASAPDRREFYAGNDPDVLLHGELTIRCDGIVIGDRAQRDPFLLQLVQKLPRRQRAIRRGRVRMQVYFHRAECNRQRRVAGAFRSVLWDTPGMGNPSVQWSNLAILIACQLISATGSIVIVTLAGIIGAGLTGNPALATLPVSMTVVALALTTVPATVLMRRIGRSRGFALASMSAVFAVSVATLAIQVESFELFVLSGMLFGINMAFTQQYRYAAAESVPADKAPLAISFVLVGSIGGALIGPELATRGRYWIDGMPYAGTMLSLAVLYTTQALLMLKLEAYAEPSRHVGRASGRALREILGQRTYIVAVLGCTAGYGLMALIMTATPLSMHVFGGHSLEATAGVIRAHVLGMYVPSLFSGFLIARLGVSRLMLAGALALLATSVIGLQGQSVLHYWWALILLGVGWNFLYVGGTTMLTYSYTPEERFRAQAVNEFFVFGTSATASLLAGTVMHLVGWTWLMLIPIPFLLLVGAALVTVRRDDVLIRRLGGA